MIPLKEIRLKKKLTQQELASKSGVAQGIISDIESGATQNPRFDTVVKLACALECPISEFVSNDTVSTPDEAKAV